MRQKCRARVQQRAEQKEKERWFIANRAPVYVDAMSEHELPNGADWWCLDRARLPRLWRVCSTTAIPERVPEMNGDHRAEHSARGHCRRDAGNLIFAQMRAQEHAQREHQWVTGRKYAADVPVVRIQEASAITR